MKSIFRIVILGLLILSGCSKPKVSMPVDDLLAFPNVNKLGIALGDSSTHRITGRGPFRLFDTTAQAITISWHEVTKPAYSILIDAASRKYHPSTNTKLPAVWRTRDGVYPWIPIDSLQMINGKPFYIAFAGPGKFRVFNWEEGKLATSGVDMLMALEGNETTEKLMSSQEAIDKKLKFRGATMEVWGSEWGMKGLHASNGNFGRYPETSNRLLSEKDLNLTTWDLGIMRNEIFARHGYIFKSHDLKFLFEQNYWYKPRFANVDDRLTDIEKQNIKLIVAREDEVYRTRPITALMKGLPLLRLPLDLESDFGERIDIPPNIENPDGTVWKEDSWGASLQALVGLLPDTSRFYGVIWYTPANLGLVQGSEPMLTTFDKKFKRIGSTELTVSIMLDPGGECNSNIDESSARLNEDLTFSARFHATITCSNVDNDGTDHGNSESEREEGLEGRIGKDGMISLKTPAARQQY